MSGRARIFQPDGRYTTYRKTMRRQRACTPSYQLPDWRLTFLLPEHDMRFLGLAPGPVEGLIGVRLLEPSICLVAGKNREWVLNQAVAFVRKVVPDFVGTISIVLSRDGEPGPTLSGPGHHPERKEGRIQIGRYDAKVLFGTTLRALHVTERR